MDPQQSGIYSTGMGLMAKSEGGPPSASVYSGQYQRAQYNPDNTAAIDKIINGATATSPDDSNAFFSNASNPLFKVFCVIGVTFLVMLLVNLMKQS